LKHEVYITSEAKDHAITWINAPELLKQHKNNHRNIVSETHKQLILEKSLCVCIYIYMYTHTHTYIYIYMNTHTERYKPFDI